MELTAMPQSQIRHRPTNTTAQVQPVKARKSRPSQVLRRRAGQPAPTTQDQALLDSLTMRNYQYQQRQSQPYQPDVYTDEDDQIAPSTRGQASSRRPAPEYQQPGRQPALRQHKHPLVYIGATLLVALLFWVVTTSGAAWYATHITDPGTYGPAHGQVIRAVLGGGDSQAQPSKVYSINDGGRVLVLKITANDPSNAQVITGPDLSKLDFPDPAGAEIAIQASDFDHDGHQDIQVTINSTSFDTPLHRYVQVYILYGDGKGNLKERTAQ